MIQTPKEDSVKYLFLYWLVFLLGLALGLFWIVVPLQVLTFLELILALFGVLLMMLAKQLLSGRERWMFLGFFRIEALSVSMPIFPPRGEQSLMMQAGLDLFILALCLKLMFASISIFSLVLGLVVFLGLFVSFLRKWILFFRWRKQTLQK